MVNNKIVPIDPINDKGVKKEIENFKFFSQYGDFKEWQCVNRKMRIS